MCGCSNKVSKLVAWQNEAEGVLYCWWLNLWGCLGKVLMQAVQQGCRILLLIVTCGYLLKVSEKLRSKVGLSNRYCHWWLQPCVRAGPRSWGRHNEGSYSWLLEQGPKAGRQAGHSWRYLLILYVYALLVIWHDPQSKRGYQYCSGGSRIGVPGLLFCLSSGVCSPVYKKHVEPASLKCRVILVQCRKCNGR